MYTELDIFLMNIGAFFFDCRLVPEKLIQWVKVTLERPMLVGSYPERVMEKIFWEEKSQ